MAVIDDFALDTTNQIIKHTSGTTVYTTRQLYSQIQDWMDNAAYMDFTPPMSAQTPTDYQVINGWYLDEGCVEWLNGGAITSSGYNTVIYKLQMSASGYISAIAGDIGKTVQNGAVSHTGTLLAYNNTTRVWWIRATLSVFTAEAVTISTGTGAGTITAVSTGEMAFPNIYTLGTIDTTGNEQQIYVIQNKTHIKIWGAAGNGDPTPDGSTQHIDVLVKTQEAGEAIDTGILTIFLRNYPSQGTTLPTHQVDLYDNFSLTALTGRNAVPLAASGDLNNTSTTATVSGYSDIDIYFINGTITHGSITNGPFTDYETVTQAVSTATGIFISENAGVMTLANVNGTFDATNIISGATASATSTGTLTINDTTRVYGKAFTQDTANDYSVIIDCANRTLAQVYEYLKYITRQDSTFQTYMVQRTAVATWGINKIDGEQYIRAYEDLYAPANSFSPVKASPFGTFAGGKLFAAQGVWLQNMAAADNKNFQLTDSDGVVQNPPNFVNVSISNLLADDSVSVFITSAGTTILRTQYTNTTQSSGAATIIVSTAITADTPAAGYLRVLRANYTEDRYYYSSWTGSTFTLASITDGYGDVLSATTLAAYSAADRTYVPFIDDKIQASGSVPVLSGTNTDTATVSVIYKTIGQGGPGDRTVLVRVRRYNGTGDTLIPFQTTGTFGSSGYSTSAIRTSDTIATT